MSDAAEFPIDLATFAADPYPDLARMRAHAPIAHVPQLGATLITRRDDIHREEKRVAVFSSHQPEGLMVQLMGTNLMRKDGTAHQAERRALFPAISPRTVRDHWAPRFRAACAAILDELLSRGHADLVADFAMPVAGHALRAITGLVHLSAAEMDGVSQAMIDGCANYARDASIEARCHAATAVIDDHISARMGELAGAPDPSALSVQMQAGLPEESIRANVKLIISGGQNEPRDAIAGTAWALLSNPDALALIRLGRATWAQAFDEYARMIAPIGMSPRRVARRDTVQGVTLEPEDRVFLMFSSANHDEAYFTEPTRFDITRDTGPAIIFGAGPHFCAGAAAARCLIAEVALPMLFARLPQLELDGPVRFHGWAFRGPVAVPVRWRAQARRQSRASRPRVLSFVGSGTTSPAEMTSLAASSTVMSSSRTSDSGTNSKNPEVGLGVVGRKTATWRSSVPIFSAISPRVSVETKAIAHSPLRGYCTRQALLKLVEDWAKTVSAICLRPL